MEHTPRQVGIAIVMLILTPVFWAGHSVVGRIVANEIPTFSLVSLRWLICAIILLLFTGPRVWAERWILLQHWRYVTMTGLIGPALFPCLLYMGLKTTTVTNTSIIQTMVPAMVPFIAWVLLRERVARAQIFGIMVSSMGVVIILTRGDLSTLGDVQFVPGDLIILAAFCAWSLYTVMIRRKPAEMHANTLLSANMVLASIVTTPLWIMEAAQGQTIPLTADALWAIGYIILFPSLLAYYFYNHAIAVVGATKAGLASHLVPPFGILLGVVFLGEEILPFHAVSFAAILTGVILVIRGGRASKNQAPA